MKKVLIICYSFPPNPGVGGRRWAKFAKYLAKNNYLVHVVSNQNKNEKVSEWLSDIDSKAIINHPQSVFYPKVYTSNPSTLIQKIEYRFWLLFFKIFSRGALYDRSFFWKKTIFTSVKTIIKENEIKNVVVTGPPFHFFYFMGQLKKEIENINLILDFRDPWTDNTSFLGFDSLSASRMKHEKMMESEAIFAADHIVSANDYLTQIFKKRYPQLENKFSTVINGYDPDELVQSGAQTTAENKNNINFVLAGTLYSDLEYLFIPFLNYLKQLKINNEGLYNRLQFNFYGHIDAKLQKSISEYNISNLHIHGFQKLQVVKQKLSDADFCMMFTTPNHASNFNTKFYEYLSIRKPIIHFSNDGEISHFILTNKLGAVIRPNSLMADFNSLIQLIETNSFEFNSSFDSKAYNTAHLTSKIEELFV